MPFGSPIEKMIAKIGEMGLEIEVIGPSHGVIWRRPEDIARILDAYERWSRFEAPERVALFYDTMWHSTEKMTMAIEDGVAQEGVECAVFKLSANPRSELARQVLESRAFLVGSPTLNNTMFPTVGEFLTYIKGLRPKNRIAGAYGSYGWGGGATKQVDAELRALGLDMLDPLDVRYMPGADDLEACHELGRTVARRVKEAEAGAVGDDGDGAWARRQRPARGQHRHAARLVPGRRPRPRAPRCSGSACATSICGAAGPATPASRTAPASRRTTCSKLYPHLRAADSIVIAAPVYAMGMPGVAKIMIDRCQPFWALKYVLKQPLNEPGGPERLGAFLSCAGTDLPHVFEGSQRTIRYLWHVLEVTSAGEAAVPGGGRAGRDPASRPEPGPWRKTSAGGWAGER